MTAEVRLVIWDMDETFWRGTLTEGGVSWREDAHDIVVKLAERGVMSTICSKNDFNAVKAILVEHGVWDYFIFPSIDWTPKGPRIKRLIETVQLRAETVMLIDDNHLNLEEAKFFSPGLQVAADTIIPTILGDPLFKGKDDHRLTRLKQYKVLEARRADEERLGATAGGNVDFLRASDIRIRIENDVEAHLDRAIELINRTNQLNFTKRRLPEDQDKARERLRKEIAHFATQAGLIAVSDKYGDYGYCGYFQVSTLRDAVQLHHFCFSCRILDMGVEAWVYQRLGRPSLEIQGEVISNPVGEATVDWIRLETGPNEGNVEEAAPALGSVAARGGCILWPLTHYFRLAAGHVVGEFNTVRDGKLIRLDHSLCLRNAIVGATEEQIQAVSPLGYVAEDFTTEFFEFFGEKPIWIFSNWADLARKVYRHNRTGILIPYHMPTTDAERAAQKPAIDYLESEFTEEIYGRGEVQNTLSLIFSKIPIHGLLYFLLINENFRDKDQNVVVGHHRQTFNKWCVEAAAPFSNVRVLRVSDFIDDQAEISNENLTHFDRKVYHRLYEHMIAEARSDLARGGGRPMAEAEDPAQIASAG